MNSIFSLILFFFQLLSYTGEQSIGFVEAVFSSSLSPKEHNQAILDFPADPIEDFREQFWIEIEEEEKEDGGLVFIPEGLGASPILSQILVSIKEEYSFIDQKPSKKPLHLYDLFHSWKIHLS